MLKKGRNVNIRTLVGRKIAQLQRFHALVFKILSTAIIHLKKIILYVCKQRHQLKLSSFISVHNDVFSLGNKSTSCGEFLCCWYFSLLLHLIESSYYLDNFLQMKLTWPVNIRRTHTVYCAFIATSRRQISCRWQFSKNYVMLWKSFSSREQLGQTLNKYPLIYILFHLYRPVGSTYSRSDFSSDHDAIPENCLRLYNKRVHVYSCQFDSMFSRSELSGSLGSSEYSSSLEP